MCQCDMKWKKIKSWGPYHESKRSHQCHSHVSIPPFFTADIAVMFCSFILSFGNKHHFYIQRSLSVHIVMALPDWCWAQNLAALSRADWIELKLYTWHAELKKKKKKSDKRLLLGHKVKKIKHTTKTFCFDKGGVWNVKSVSNYFCHAAPSQDRCPDFCHCISRRMQRCLKHEWGQCWLCDLAPLIVGHGCWPLAKQNKT